MSTFYTVLLALDITIVLGLFAFLALRYLEKKDRELSIKQEKESEKYLKKEQEERVRKQEFKAKHNLETLLMCKENKATILTDIDVEISRWQVGIFSDTSAYVQLSSIRGSVWVEVAKLNILDTLPD